MFVYSVLSVLLILQGVLSLEESCDKSNDEKKITSYDCGQSRIFRSKKNGKFDEKQSTTSCHFPWHATILNETSDGWDLLCGGTLVTAKAIITAAHCVTTYQFYEPLVTPLDLQTITVILGKTSSTWDKFSSSEVRKKVVGLQVHPEYKGGLYNFDYDIALVLLDSNVPFSRLVMPVCLDFNSNVLSPYERGDIGYISGFGYTAECGPTCSKRSDTLMYATSRIMDFEDCIDTLHAIDSSKFVSLSRDKFCFGNGSASPFQKGDGGGGITVTHRRIHYLMGVANAKMVNSESRKLIYSMGTAANVTYFMDWIKENLPQPT